MGEQQKPGFPETYDLLPHPLRRIVRTLGGLLTPFHTAAEDYYSTHYTHPLDGDIEPIRDWSEEPNGDQL